MGHRLAKDTTPAQRARRRRAPDPTKEESDSLNKRIDAMMKDYAATIGGDSVQSWADAQKKEKVAEQLYRNEILRVQALKDSAALVPVHEVAARDEFTAKAFVWGLGELLEWVMQHVPAHQRNALREQGDAKVGEILEAIAARVAQGMAEMERDEAVTMVNLAEDDDGEA
jgi:hypothetical protein